MNDWLLMTCTLTATFVTTISAIGAKVLNDFSRHEFEEYCKRRKNSALFRQLVENHRQYCLGAEVLEMLGISVMVLCGAHWLLGVTADNQTVNLPRTSLIPAVLVSTAILLLISSWIPWAIVEYFSAPFLYFTWRIWWFFSVMFKPVLIGMEFVGGFLGRLSGHVENPDEEEEEIEDEILSMVSAGQTGGFLHSEAREMIEGVIELDDLVVSKIMTPRGEVNAVSVETSLEQLVVQCLESRHSRLPVYRDSLDNVIGVLHTRDILTEALKPKSQRRPVNELMRKPLKTPDSRFVNEMLKVFLQPGNKMHLAVVVNEHHTTVGVITIEDILEEIVGDITDETDRQSENGLRVLSETTVEVPGKFRIDELNDLTDFEIPEDDEYDTVAGWIMFHMGEVPRANMKLEADSVRASMLKCTPRRIELVRLENLQPVEDSNHNDAAAP